MPINFNVINVQNYHSFAKEGASYITLLTPKQQYSQYCLNILDEKTICQLKEVNNFKAKPGESLGVIVKLNDKMVPINILAIDELDNLKGDAYLKLGGDTYNCTKKQQNIVLDLSILDISQQALCDILVGFELASYRFDKYFVKKSKKESDDKDKILTILVKEDFDKAILEEAKSIASSVILARNLVNEPANILNTVEFKNKIVALQKIGVEVTILEKNQLEELKMHALLGVAKGSNCPPYVAIMHWRGQNNNQNSPVVFVGKGVVFDSGGISIKPAANMEDMKGDMGGAAAVVGAIHCLAKRKSCANVIGIVGLVENMVDAAAQRPGDVITSMSGQTIEVINTDAEGRLVLADILHYAKENFSPQIMVNLATLTGAIVIALGHSKAGLFSNNQELINKLLNASAQTGEQLWNMPLCDEYDKLVDSKVADMRNSAGRLAASSTAAQFLKRFVGDVSWAHLDIAGTASGMPEVSYCHSWASGFGVRLLDRLIRDNYEV